jgi:formyl-CoA transferase
MIERHALGANAQVLLPGFVPKMSETPGETRWIGPRLGEHTDAVLAAAGYGEAQLGDLRARGVIG